MYPLTPTV